MSFKWKVVRPFVAASGNVAVTTAGLNLEFETGSIEEALGFFADKSTALSQIFGGSIVEQFAAAAAGIGVAGDTKTGETNAAPTETAAQKKAREKREAKEKSDAARVNVDPPTAPPPAPVGGAPAPDTTPGPNGIPAFLDRTKEAAAAAPPPPPTPPVAPPPPPTPPVPPAGVLAAKIIPHMEGVAAQQNDGGKAWVDWLASSQIVVPGATFEEAMKVIRMQPDERLKPIANALGIAA